MANRLHDTWLSAKKSMEKDIADVKKNGGLNPKQLEDALKSFSGGLGPLLDKTAAAYKAGKDADVKKNAGAAAKVANAYLTTVTKISNERGGYAKLVLKTMIGALQKLEATGAATKPSPF